MKSFLKIVRYVYPYWGYALLNILFNILSVIFSLFSLTMIVPFLQILFETAENTPIPTSYPGFEMSREGLTDLFYYGTNQLMVENSKVESLLWVCLFVVVMFFFKNMSRYMAMFFIAPIRNGVLRDLRNDIYKKITILPLSYYTSKRKGDILTRITSDVQEIEWSILNTLVMIFRDPLAILMFLGSLFIVSPRLTLFSLVLLPVTAIFIGRVGQSLRRTSAKAQGKLGDLLSIIEESISGLRIIKAFNAIGFSNKKFQENNEEYTKIGIRMYRKKDLASPLSEFLSIMVMVVILWFGGKLVLDPNSDSLSPDLFIMYILVFSQLIVPVKSFATSFSNIQKGIASNNRIQEVLDAKELIIEKENALEKTNFEEKIEYKDVFFEYEEDKPVLKTINLKVKKGETLAVVGPSGGGKSTLVDLLPRFYDCVGGKISIDGTDIKDIRIDHLRELMGIVTQETILFNDSIYNNIAFGMKGVSEEDIVKAAKIANVHEFVEVLEKGYETNIGDRGAKFSGGQRQRLSIARAVLKNPPIMILDEATSSLDTESEQIVQNALDNLMKNHTSIVIAHRLSTIKKADRIIVIDKGEIVEEGKHDDLFSQKGLYKKLCDLQSFS
jgi:ATP-binding cassette, subfamily B, bacterial MsbA